MTDYPTRDEALLTDAHLAALRRAADTARNLQADLDALGVGRARPPASITVLYEAAPHNYPHFAVIAQPGQGSVYLAISPQGDFVITLPDGTQVWATLTAVVKLVLDARPGL